MSAMPCPRRRSTTARPRNPPPPGCVAAQQVDLRRTEITRIDFHMVVPVEPYQTERGSNEIFNGVRLAGGDHIVVGGWLLEHEPHSLDVLRCVTPVPLRLEIS